MFHIPWESLIGGMLVGLSVALLMLVTGKTAGISGIMNGAFLSKKNEQAHDSKNTQLFERLWQKIFLLSMCLGGYVTVLVVNLWLSKPGQLHLTHLPVAISYDHPLWQIVIAGLLVGCGTRLANGCTSGHGICGIGRFSKRSLIATCVFMLSAMLTVWGMKG